MSPMSGEGGVSAAIELPSIFPISMFFSLINSLSARATNSLLRDRKSAMYNSALKKSMVSVA